MMMTWDEIVLIEGLNISLDPCVMTPLYDDLCIMLLLKSER